MVADGGQNQTQYWELQNETAVNVAGLLKAQIGATRWYRLHLDRFEADGETIAREVEGDVRLTRLRDGVMATLKVKGVAPLECVACLREYDQPFAIEFDEEFVQTVDVRTGTGLGIELVEDDGSERSLIDENHEIDLREALRQEILVALPMRPSCGPDCPGPDVPQSGVGMGEDIVDERLAALASLLGDDAPEKASST
jgi:uncharacterized protein